MEYLIIILGMGIVTYLPRLLPLWLLNNRQLPYWLEEGLEFLPAAIMGALLLPQILLPGGTREIQFMQPHFLAALPTLLIALKIRSLALTVVAGMGFYWLWQRLL